MAIYNIFDYYEREVQESGSAKVKPSIDPGAFATNHIDENYIQGMAGRREQLFSALAARFFFLLLLIADLLWGAYAIVMFAIKLTLNLLFFGKVAFFSRAASRSWLSVKRSIVCAISLIVAIFSPALGIMFSCMYFLMYDKTGVDEVVPSSLRDQFKELFPAK